MIPNFDMQEKPELPPWGTRFSEERLELLTEIEKASERLKLAQISGDPEEIEIAEREHQELYDRCAKHRVENVNNTLALLRMTCQDDPGSVAQIFESIIQKKAREVVRPVALAVARLEDRQ
ncbi:MAG: hypothetical protein R3B84_10915 [Zavarzinella sp.]